MLPYKAPKRFMKRSVLWNAVESAETRKNSQTAKHIDAALPVEISRDEQIDLVQKFCQQCFVSRGMCVDFAIHDKKDGNPHVHILLNTRRVNEHGFTTKDRSWNDKVLLLEWRKLWADWCNHKLNYASDERIDHRSYKAQGIDKIPQIHLGAAACAIEKKGFKTDKSSKNRKIILDNTDAEIERLKFQIVSLYDDKNDLIKEMLESEVGCPVSEMLTFTDTKEIMDKIEIELLKRNIQFKIANAGNNNLKIFMARKYDNEVYQLWQQIKNENQELTAAEKSKDKPVKKHCSR